jgi:CAAX protease family protein
MGATVREGTEGPYRSPGMFERRAVAPATTAQVAVFFVLTYATTWTAFIVAGLLPGGWDGLRWPLLLIGSIGPSAVAIALTARAQGRAGVRELLGRLLQWRVGLRWYMFALGFLAAVKLGVAVVYRVANGSWPHFGGQTWYATLMAIVAAGIFGGPLGEEIGWRGYALPRLSQRFGLATASLLLGVVWC